MIPPARPTSAPTPAPRFAALHTRDYRRYFALSLTAMTADNIEHVISYWVIYQAFLCAVLDLPLDHPLCLVIARGP